ncbi:MAG: inositol monophosphatase [Deltaproteobacteria bacterium]|nr:MAG: inositol monophosphatase [Deltaproteobacteria bacterium]
MVEGALDAAIKAAMAAGEIQRERFDSTLEIKKKGVVDLVTDVDIACEERIREILGAAFPDLPVLGEEEGELGGTSDEVRWIVDPIDGTTNFAHSIPIFCSVIALEEAGEITAGVIYETMGDKLYTAIKGGGAFMNGEPIAVTSTEALVDSLLATGFPYDNRTNPRDIFGAFAATHKSCRGLRRFGSAAIDLAYVACGIFDGFWEIGLKPWDMAAGALLVAEAGGVVSKIDGSTFDHMQGEIVASNGPIHGDLLKVLSEYL